MREGFASCRRVGNVDRVPCVGESRSNGLRPWTAGELAMAGLAICDTMQYVRPAVQTFYIGLAASAASLLCAGARSALYRERLSQRTNSNSG